MKPLNELATIVDDNITKGGFDVERMYVNTYNFGDCPTVHSDHDSEGFCTMLYYANPERRPDWAGETVFYDQQRNDIIKAVYPKPSRIVFFDSRIPHSARAPSRICDFIRYTIAMKLVKHARN